MATFPRKKRPPISEETRMKLRLASSGENNPNYGKKNTPGMKLRQRLAQLGPKGHAWGKHPSKETLEKRSKSMMGKNKGKLEREKHWNWKGGITLHRFDGRHTDNKRRKLYSRIVSEGILGRELKRREVIHHIDGNPSNDNPENLYYFRHQSAHAKWHAYIRRHQLPGTLLKSNLDIYTTTQ